MGVRDVVLGILIGDDYGHKVVTFVGLAGACLALYSLLQRATRSSLLSMAAKLCCKGRRATFEVHWSR